MPAATFQGPPLRPDWDSRVFIVVVYPNGDRMLTEVVNASLTLTAEHDDIAWWHGVVGIPPSRTHVQLEGYLGEGVPYRGPIPGDQPELPERLRALPSAPDRALEQ